MALKMRQVISLLCLSLGCSRGDPTKQDRGQAPGTETEPASAATVRATGSSSAVAAANAHGTRLEGPRDQNMGRNFEGRLQLRVNGLRGPLAIRYLSRGDRGRLQIDRPGAASFDAIFAGDQAIVLDHTHRRYRTYDLNTVAPRAEATQDVQVERATDRREMSGLLCYPWRLSSGRQKVEACVRGLPGPFDTDKLETLSNLDLPAWLERLLSERYLPISATVTEDGRRVYDVEILQYSPDEVSENELSVPENYQKL